MSCGTSPPPAGQPVKLAQKPIVDPALQEYAERTSTTPRPQYLDELDERTREELGMGLMLCGPVVGRLLETLAFLCHARRILEVGTFSGVSALHLAEGMPAEGRIVTCEINPEFAAFARAAIAGSPHAGRIEVREGPAMQTISALPGPFDLVFIDADKASYRSYVELLVPKLAMPRGLLVLDNTLWEGEVIQADRSGTAEAVDRLNRWLVSRSDLTAVQLTVRDGVTLVRRKY